jgi:predicted GNAT family N-acyltransferase
MINVVKFSSKDAEHAGPAFEIRRQVFVVEQQVPPDEEFDEFESASVHFLATINGVPAGTARWRRTEKGIKLERFAVLDRYRSHGVGRELLQNVLKDVLPTDSTIYLHSQLHAVTFYEKSGFKAVGELFYECEIPHYLMKYAQVGHLKE